MAAALFNLAIGVTMLVAGVSGELTLLGTQSQTALAIAGGAVAAFGVVQLLRGMGR